jgi:hypothetical protein
LMFRVVVLTTEKEPDTIVLLFSALRPKWKRSTASRPASSFAFCVAARIAVANIWKDYGEKESAHGRKARWH